MDDGPVVPRPAATVLLLRDRAGLEVFLQRRVRGMAFAGGMTVFPGGGVDPSDRVGPEHWVGPDPAWWAARLACTADEAGPWVCAAVRETFEECGVLLAGPDAGTVAQITPGLAAERARLVARETTLPAILDAAGLVLRADLLAPWARWITPETSPRRYDTLFLLARVPVGQEADDRTTEAVEARWWRPADALAAFAEGEIELMAPTWRTVEELAEPPDVASAWAATLRRDLAPLLPRVRRDGERLAVVLPHDPDYPTAADHLQPGGSG